MANLASGLAAGLTSALSTYTTIRDENRKSKLFDLQTESYNLQNEGRRIDNRFKRETYADRAGIYEGDHRKADASAGIEESKLRVQQELEGDLVEQGKQDTRWKTLRADTQGAALAGQGYRNRELRSNAVVAEQTQDARVSIKRTEAEDAALDLDTKRMDAVSERMTGLGAGRTLHENIVSNAEYHGSAVALLSKRYKDQLGEGQTISRVIPTGDGGYALMDSNGKPITLGRSSDPDDEAIVLSEQQLRYAIHGTKAGDSLQTDATYQQADDVVRSKMAGELGASADQLAALDARITDNKTRREQAKTLEAQKLALEEERASLAEATSGSVMTPRSAGRASVGDQRRLQEVEASLKALDGKVTQAGLGDVLNGDAYAAEQERLAGLRRQEEARPASIQSEYGSLSKQARQAIVAGNDDVVPSLMNGLSPNVTVADATASTKLQEAKAAPLQDVKARVIENATTVFKAEERERDLPTFAAGIDAAVANNPVLLNMSQTAGGASQVEAILSSASSIAISGNKPVGAALNGLLRYQNPKAFEAIMLVADDQSVRAEDRLAIANAAADLVERNRGMSPTAAATAAMQQYNRIR